MTVRPIALTRKRKRQKYRKEKKKKKKKEKRKRKAVTKRFMLHVNVIMNLLMTLSREINEDKYKWIQIFFQNRARYSFINVQFSLQSYSDTDNHISNFSETFKCNRNRQKYLNINNFINRVSIVKIRYAPCKLALVTGRWNKVLVEHRIRQICTLVEVQSERYFFFDCASCNQLRKLLSNTNGKWNDKATISGRKLSTPIPFCK